MLIKRNAFMRLRFTKPPQLDLLLEGETFEVRQHDALRALALASELMDSSELDARMREGTSHAPGHFEPVLNELMDVKALVPQDYQHPLFEAALHWQRRGWLDALILHLRSRDIQYVDFGEARFRPQIGQMGDFPALANESYCAPGAGIPLPQVGDELWDAESLLAVMQARRSGEPWTSVRMDEFSLARLLRMGTRCARMNRIAVTDADPQSFYDGSSYDALETYLITNQVEGLGQGVYRYLVESHSLQALQAGDFSQDLVDLCIGQGKVRGCAVALLICAQWHRYYARYRHARAYRNLLINTAELAHGYILAATKAGYSNFITPAFRDSIAQRLLGRCNLEMGPLYLVAVG